MSTIPFGVIFCEHESTQVSTWSLLSPYAARLCSFGYFRVHKSAQVSSAYEKRKSKSTQVSTIHATMRADGYKVEWTFMNSLRAYLNVSITVPASTRQDQRHQVAANNTRKRLISYRRMTTRHKSNALFYLHQRQTLRPTNTILYFRLIEHHWQKLYMLSFIHSLCRYNITTVPCQYSHDTRRDNTFFSVSFPSFTCPVFVV